METHPTIEEYLPGVYSSIGKVWVLQEYRWITMVGRYPIEGIFQGGDGSLVVGVYG